MNTLQLISMGVWLAITIYTTYGVVLSMFEEIEGSSSILGMTASIGWAGIILYHTFN
jgi:hypothetical protein